MSEFAAFVDQGWTDHAGAPQAVADRLNEGFALMATGADVESLARLAEHVYGAHLGRWDDGLRFLAQLAEHANRSHLLDAGSEAGAMIDRLVASLTLCRGPGDPRDGRSASERQRIGALASSALALHDAPRALAMLTGVLQEAADSRLPDADPANRTLAVCGNNIALAMEELPARNAGQRALMITGAETARYYWERAGTWINVERAAYRLAHIWLKAGDPEQARWHAASCLQMVRAHGDVPLECFFAHEALALVDRARGDVASARSSLASMRSDFERLSADEQSWCRASLEQVEQGFAA